MRILNTILLVLILLVASGGAAYYYFTTSGQLAPEAQAQEPAKPVVAAPIFLALEPFTVTLRGERGSQILYTEITLRLNETESHTTLVQYMPEVRNRVLAELAQHTASELQTTEGRNALAGRLKRVLSASFHPHLSAPGISSVLFTAFVIQ
ncbi:flagellar basal body-associated FliL family protein [Pusillimonas sp.]|uniref:flagellar basal body-associated FliL family protein n=1 Tax=Pusillimonas sp. TaxID=3040095 RepID=UPI0029ACB6EF|nr:flagellar basal body-associated FliL family protein [Pusillimonas sp.]MDX3894110.1 flagellar basal body-associated FliL family protein [Pusillimonas sp.]